MNGDNGKYAWTVSVGAKGEIVIPKQAREVFDIKPGDVLVVLGQEDHGIIIPPKTIYLNPNKPISDWYFENDESN